MVKNTGNYYPASGSISHPAAQFSAPASRPPPFVAPTGWIPYPSGTPAVIYAQRAAGRPTTYPPTSQGGYSPVTVAEASTSRNVYQKEPTTPRRRNRDATPTSNDAPRPSKLTYPSGTHADPIVIDDSPVRSSAALTGAKPVRGDFARRIREESMPLSARTLSGPRRKGASLAISILPPSASAAPQVSKKRKRSTDDGAEHHKASDGSAASVASTIRGQKRARKVAATKAKSLPATVQAPSQGCSSMCFPNPSDPRKANESSTVAKSVPTRPATASPRMAVPIPVAAAVPIPVAAAVPIPVAAAVPTPIVAVVHDLLSEGNGGSVVSAETKTLDGAPSIEAVVTAEKMPQSAAPPVVAAMIDLNFGAPQSSGADEDDFQDLFGDLSSDD